MAEPHEDKTSPYESLRVDRADGVVTITLDRPATKNAINGAMWNELASVVAEIARSSADRVVVITGAGGEFCSGADLAEPSANEEHHLARLRRVGDLCLAIARLPQPTIAKVRGVAVGAGLNLALVCDLVVAAERPRFSEIFAKRGLSLDFGGSWILPRLVGMHRAKELALLAPHHRRQGSRGHRARQPRVARGRARRVRRRLGCRARRRTADRAGA